MRKVYLLFLLISTFIAAQKPIVYEHISNTAIYTFLDELAVSGAISLNKMGKPYARSFIAEKLLEAQQNVKSLNKRQKEEVLFYMQSFKVDTDVMFDSKFGKLDVIHNPKWATSLDPLGGFYKDSLATFALKPILGYQVWSNENGSQSHRWSGFDAYGYVGKNFGFYASLRDNIESEWFEKPEYLTRRAGVPVKSNYDGEKGQVAYSEMRGGATYAWKWGNLGLVKDHVEWGTNYAGSNIFSGRTPSFAMVQFNMKPTKWLEFNYYHGWLASAVLDSSASYYGNPITFRPVYHKKNIAANMLSILPWQHTRISVGNSIIYSDLGAHPAYLNPFMFYKSVDHITELSGGGNNDSGNNAQMYAEVSTMALKHFHFYASLFIDEISMSKVADPDLNTNLLSYKLGFKTYNLISNVSFTFEYTKNRPMVYEHYINTTTFENAEYNLGHYLRENAHDFYAEIAWKPIRGLHLLAAMNFAQKGPEIMNDENMNKGQTFMETVEWQKQQWLLKASYEVLNNAYVFMHYQMANIVGDQRYHSSYFNGETNTFSIGFANNF